MAEKILGRPVVYRDKLLAVKALVEGRRDWLVRRSAEDQVELWRKLKLDMIPCGLNVSKRYMRPRQVSEDEFLWIDEVTGFQRRVRFIPETGMMSEVDSSIARGGLDALETYVRCLEEDEVEVGEDMFERLRYVVKQVGNELLVAGGADCTFPVLQSWMHVFLKAIYLKPDLVRRLIREAKRRAIEYAKAQIDAEAEVIIGGADWAYKHGPFMSPMLFREFVMPALKELVDTRHKRGALYIKHTDGNVMPLMDMIVECCVDGFHAIELQAGMDIEVLKRLYGDKFVS